MNAQDIVKSILDYFNNTILLIPNLTPRGFGQPLQLERQLKIDILDTVPQDSNDCRIYPVENINQVYEVLYGVTGKGMEGVRKDVDSFVYQNNIDTTKELYLIAYLVGKRE